MDSPVVTVQEEAKFYQMSDLIADAGGYMGLLLGASVFTFYELFDAFVKKFIRKERECRGGKSTTPGA